MSKGFRFGDWVIRDNFLGFTGAPHNMNKPYEISRDELIGKTDWVKTLRIKRWFTKDVERDFLEAVYYVCCYQPKLTDANQLSLDKKCIC